MPFGYILTMDSGEKLVVAQANFHQLWGGQAEVVLSLAKSLNHRGHRAIVIAPPGSELAKRAADARVETFTGCRFVRGFRPLAFWSDVHNLRRFLSQAGVQIYHCHGSQDHWIGACAALGMRQPPKIVRTRHNIYPVKNHIFNRWIFRTMTAQVITIFGEQARYFTETGLLKASQLFTLHSPLPQEFVEAVDVPRVVRTELGLAADVPLIGFAANFHADKAPLNFVAAAERIAAQMPNAHFAMAGHGPLEAAVREQVARANLAPRFHLLGFRKDILNVMASFDLLALPSVTREASSTVLKQAASLSKPVVATDVGGTREVVEDGVTGIIVPTGDVAALADAILKLLRNPQRAAEMGSAGRVRVLNHFAAHAIAGKTEALYRKLLTKGAAVQEPADGASRAPSG